MEKDRLIHTINRFDHYFDSVNNKTYFYTYDTSCSTPESSPDYINPDSNTAEAEDYRWVLTMIQSNSAFMRNVLDATTFATYMSSLSIEYDHIFLPAAAFYPSTTSGAGGLTLTEYSDTGVLDLLHYDFDGGATDEYIFANIKFPPSWDLSTIKLKFHWAGASGCSQADIVTWGADAVVLGNDDNIDGTAHGTSVTVDDAITAGLDGDILVSGATGALTIAGTPALGDIINLRVYRDADGSEGSDDMTEDAYLFGVTIQYKRTSTTAAW